MFLCLRVFRNFSINLQKSKEAIMNKTTKIPLSARLISSSKSTFKPPENYAFKILPTPQKSDSDKKEYKVIQLTNGLTACLISDKSPVLSSETDDYEVNESDEEEDEELEEECEEDDDQMSIDEMDYETQTKKKKHPEQKLAAAGLCIGTGSFSDPKEVPGLAHFLEHMVFMGSEKYPKENSFDEFIKRSGGNDNASTDCETTVFYFECLVRYLEEGLDMFSQFFTAPLMKKEAMTREREAVESEFQMAVQSDSSRKEQLLSSLAKKECPVNSFLWGNLITLKNNIKDKALYKAVHEFRKRHYSAHRMTLVVQARLPLEELEKYVLKYFSQIPNNELPPSDYTKNCSDVFNTTEFNKIYYVNPVNDLLLVDITWAFPSLKDKYRSKPQHVISFLLGDEGKGSIFSYLKKKCWVIGTTIGNNNSGMEHNSLFTLFTVTLNLTNEGYNHLNDVIETIFSYIKMLQQIEIPQRIFEELQLTANMNFKYAKEEDPIDIVEDLCEAMQMYAPEDYLTGSELYFEFEPKVVKSLLEQMTPDKANYMVFKQQNDINEDYLTEPWFGTRYLVKTIPESWLNQWKEAPINSELSIPLPNSFMTKDFTLLPELPNNPEYPIKILANNLAEVWYRRDMKFKLPNARYYFYLITPLSVSSCRNSCLFDAAINLLAIDLSEDVYPATKASLYHSFQTFERGLTLKLHGFNEKLPVLLKLIANHLTNLSDSITEDLFNAMKDKLLMNYYNTSLKPDRINKDIRLNLLMDNNWNSVEKYKAMKDVTIDETREFCRNFLKVLYVKVLIQGNVSDETAINTVKDFLATLNCKELDPALRPKYHVARVNLGERCIRVKNINVNDTNSIITNYYQSDVYTIENSSIVELIMMIIQEPLFDILRTKEQLGYDVACSIRDTYGVLGYTITVNAQATKVTVKHVDERIEAFLTYSQSLLTNLKDEEFQKIKDSLIKMKQCDDVHLKEEAGRNWSEITSDDYIFERNKREIEVLEKITLETIRNWWKEHSSKEKFRKLSIQVQGASSEDGTNSPKLELVLLENAEEAKAKNNKEYFIKSIEEYKKSVEIFHVK